MLGDWPSLDGAACVIVRDAGGRVVRRKLPLAVQEAKIAARRWLEGLGHLSTATVKCGHLREDGRWSFVVDARYVVWQDEVRRTW